MQRFVRRDHRQRDAERRAVSRTVALDPDATALRFDQVSRDEESQAEAANAPRHRTVQLTETFEHVR